MRSLPHQIVVLPKPAADVLDEPEGARLVEARASAAVEQETDDVVLTRVGRDQERGITALVPSAGEIRAGRQQIGNALRVAAPDGTQEIGESAHEVRARERGAAGYARMNAGVGWSASSQGPGKRPLSPFSENGRSRCHSLRGCS